MKEEDFCINPNYKLIPFAFMASGDVYCFLYTHKDNKEDDDPLIIVYGHDTGDFYVWANNFEEFLFWQIVSELTDYEGDIQSEQIQYNISLLSKEYIEQLKCPIQKLIEKIPNPKPVDIFVLNKRK
ncbi:MAG: SMI1/KNR4 family protein [Clostridium sp.]